MNPLISTLACIAALQLSAHAGEMALAAAYIPVDSPADAPVQAVSVPFYTSGAYPEALISAITEPYCVKQGKEKEASDLNKASVAKLKIFGTDLYEEGNPKSLGFYVQWDFSNADPELINEHLIAAVIVCIQKTLPNKKVIYSRFIGAEKFPEIEKQIVKVFPLARSK